METANDLDSCISTWPLVAYNNHCYDLKFTEFHFPIVQQIVQNVSINFHIIIYYCVVAIIRYVSNKSREDIRHNID